MWEPVDIIALIVFGSTGLAIVLVAIAFLITSIIHKGG
jgi:hypothetical protein